MRGCVIIVHGLRALACKLKLNLGLSKFGKQVVLKQALFASCNHTVPHTMSLRRLYDARDRLYGVYDGPVIFMEPVADILLGFACIFAAQIHRELPGECDPVGTFLREHVRELDGADICDDGRDDPYGIIGIAVFQTVRISEWLRGFQGFLS